MWSLLWWCLQSALTSLRQWDARIFRIWESAVKLLPVPLRTDGVTQPTPAQSLVDYKTSEVRTLGADMGTRRIFSRSGHWGGLNDGSPPQSPGAAPRWGPGGQAPRSWRHFLKTMHKYFVYWSFGQHLQQKNTRFNIFRGANAPLICPLAHACGRPCVLPC